MTDGAAEAITDARRDQWRRSDDLRFRRRLKTVVIDLAAVVAIGSALWFAFQF